MITRRSFLHTTAGGLATLPLLAKAEPAAVPAVKPGIPATKLRIGMAGYTVRELSVEDALRWMSHWGVRSWAVRRDHLPLTATEQTIAELRAKADAAGIQIYTAGVINLNTEAEVDEAFAYAKKLGVSMFVSAPALDLLPAVEKQVQATGIRVAIHNHGPDVFKGMRAAFDTPDTVYSAVRNLDSRIGLCIDIGHTQRCGVNPTESFLRCADRVLDFHLKDVSASTKDGFSVPLGRGVIDIPGFLQAVSQAGFTGVLSLEHETARIETLTGISESIGYLRGMGIMA